MEQEQKTKSLLLKSSRFRYERQKSWVNLEALLAIVQKKGLNGLSATQVAQLPALYRSAVSSLSVARAISLDKNLLDYLESLVSRAYLCVYANQRFSWDVIRDFFLVKFPASVQRFGWHILISTLVLFSGVAVSFALTNADIGRYETFVPAAMAGGRTPDSKTEELRDAIYSEIQDSGALTMFASHLFTNNAKVSILCFALGFLAGVPVIILLFYNGLMLGAMIALYHSRGLGMEFTAWVAGHGVTELLAVILSGAAGLALAQGLLFPQRFRRVDSLAIQGRAVAPMIVGAVLMLVLAAIIEGYLRQMLPLTSVRWAIAAVTGAFWLWYLAFRRYGVSLTT